MDIGTVNLREGASRYGPAPTPTATVADRPVRLKTPQFVDGVVDLPLARVQSQLLRDLAAVID
ncbi:MAG TPA: hypothetical protein VMR29_01640, partial [Candidatus Binatia bacterium]|nr:hypothetical protein [Candidatus Binatia bacterium]